jgi:hypothetical protein
VTQILQPVRPASINAVHFSVAAHAAWAPGRDTLSAMPPLLRRRASPAGKMALQAAYDALANRETSEIPTVFCSRHGECARSVELLSDLAQQLPLSPTAFSLSVHNATGGLFSIARGDRSNSLALAAGCSTIEHAAIEACGLLADGAAAVLLVAADGPLPAMYSQYTDCNEQSFGWAWLLQATDTATSPNSDTDAISLRWSRCTDATPPADEPGGVQIMRFFLSGERSLQRIADQRRWVWSRDA